MKVNKFEKEFLRPLKIIKILFTVNILFNIFLPLYAPYSIWSGWQYKIPIIIFNIWGFMGGLHYNNSTTSPLLQVCLIRTLQGSVSFIAKTGNSMNWIVFAIQVIADFIFCFYLLYFHNKYKFIEEE